MQQLVSETIRHGRDVVDPAALAAQVRLFRSAALIGANQTAARSGTLMKKHNALARRLLDRQDDYLRFTADFRAPPDNNVSVMRSVTRVPPLVSHDRVGRCAGSVSPAGVPHPGRPNRPSQ